MAQADCSAALLDMHSPALSSGACLSQDNILIDSDSGGSAVEESEDLFRFVSTFRHLATPGAPQENPFPVDVAVAVDVAVH